MARRYRTRGQYLAAEFREFLGVCMGLAALAGGALLLATIARSLHLI